MTKNISLITGSGVLSAYLANYLILKKHKVIVTTRKYRIVHEIWYFEGIIVMKSKTLQKWETQINSVLSLNSLTSCSSFSFCSACVNDTMICLTFTQFTEELRALRITFSSIRAPRCGWNRRISNASSANLPRTRLARCRTLRALIRAYLCVAV